MACTYKTAGVPLLVVLAACSGARSTTPPPASPSGGETASSLTQEQKPTQRAPAPLDDAARKYVELVLALGVHDPDFVDAYYGPSALRDEATAKGRTLAAIRAEAKALRDELASLSVEDGLPALRRGYLDRQLASLIVRTELLEGARLSFDEESMAVYDAVSPTPDETYFEALLRELSALVPGKGPLEKRYDAFRKQFEIPRDRLAAVFDRAIAGCRERTLAHVKLPEEESFTVEYVTDKPWSAYNWYQGHYRSLIQVNISLPIYIERAIDLACHEGYPGHHVYNVLLEQHLVRAQNFLEFTVYPLFSAQSLIAEGSANYGVELAFPGETRWQWERAELFPLAGLDTDKAELYYRILGLTEKLSYAGNTAARRYLDGELTRDEALRWLERYMLLTPERAEQRMRFIEKYRAYVINYNLGQDLVRAHVERLAGDDAEQRWRVFVELLSSPTLPSGLVR